MSTDSPAAVLVDGSGVALAVQDGVALPASTPGIVSAGVDGSGNVQFIKTDTAGKVIVDGSGVTQPVSATSLPLPTGASTETTVLGIKTGTDKLSAKTSDYDTGAGTDTVALLGIALPANGGAVAGGTATNPVRTDPTGTTAQPITDNGGSLTVDGTVAVSSVGGTVTVQDGGNVISIDDAGGSLTVDGTVGVSGTVAISASSLPLPTGASTETTLLGVKTGTDKLSAKTLDYDTGVGTDTIALLGLALPASGGAVAGGTATNPVRVDVTGTTAQPITDNGGNISIDDGGNSITVDGTVAVSGTVAISASALPLPTGASTESTLGDIKTGTNKLSAKTSDYDTGAGTDTVAMLGIALPASGGAVAGGTATNPLKVDPTGTTAQPITDNGGNISIDDGGNSITVDGSVTVSGTVTANIGSVATLALDATLTAGTAKAIIRGGAKGGTAAADVTSTAEGADHQAVDVQLYHGGTAINPQTTRALTSSDVVTIQATNTALPVTDNAGSLTVDSPQLPSALGQTTMAASMSVTIASNQSAISVSSSVATSTTGTTSTVASSASSVNLLALNASRKGAMIVNDSTSVLYVKFGTTASTTDYTVRMMPNDYYEVPFNFTGRIDGIWSSANGNARLTEMT
jgi:hypothetical protein